MNADQPLSTGTIEVSSLDGEWELLRSERRPVGSPLPPDITLAYRVGIGHVPGNVHLDLGFQDLNLDTEELVSVNDFEWLYLRTFPTPASHGSTLLHFDGVDYFCDVWVNGSLAGHHEGCYTEWDVDITTLLMPSGSQNEVMLAISMPWRVDERAYILEPATRSGAFIKNTEYMRGMFSLYSDFALDGYAVAPFGPWRGVTLVTRSGPTLTRLSASTLAIDGSSAKVRFDLEWWSDDPTPRDVAFELRIARDGASEGAVTHGLAVNVPPGRSDSSVELTLDDVALWWTWDTGPQNLYRVDALGTSALFGIREFTREPETMVFRINGTRTFARGTWVTPPDVYSSRPDITSLTRDVEMLREAHMNHVVIFSHVQRPEYYEAFDRAGILVIQQLPFLQFGPGKLVEPDHPRHEAYWNWSLDEVDAIVRALRGHPSLIMWGAFAEVLKDGVWAWNDYGAYSDAIAAIVRRLDHDATYHASFCDFGEEHIWDGGHGIGEFTDHYDRNEKFISEFGSVAPPIIDTLREMIPPESFWGVPVKEGSQIPLPIDVEDWAYVWGYDYPGLTNSIARTLRWMDRKLPTPERFVDAVQAYQAFGYRYCAEIYRRARFNEIAGARAWAFRMSQAAASYSLVDHRQRPKMSYFALVRAFAPLHLQVDDRYPLAPQTEGSTWRRRALLINDLQAPAAVVVSYTLRDVHGDIREAGERRVAVAADDAADFPVEFDLPEPGLYLLRLVAAADDGESKAICEQWIHVAPRVVEGPAIKVLLVGQTRYGEPVATALGQVGGVEVTTLDETNRSPQDASWTMNLRERFDVIWFAGWDMASQQFTKAELAAVADAVRAGIGFIHTGGQASFHGYNGRAALLDRTPLADVIPLRMRPHDMVVDRWPTIDGGTLTADFGIELGSLPSYGGFARTSVEPDTRVLATIGEFPLLATGIAGEGRTVALTAGLTRWGSVLKCADTVEEFGDFIDPMPSFWKPGGIRDYALHWSGNLDLFLVMLQLATGRELVAPAQDLADEWIAPTFERLAELPTTTLAARTIAVEFSADTNLTSGIVEVENTGRIVARLVRGTVEAPTLDSRFRDGFLDLLPGERAELRFEAACLPDAIAGLTINGQNCMVAIAV